MDLQNGEVIEDWELFADPKEAERRKAERKRQALPLEERQHILASEWVDARSHAATAKAQNDKAQQKAMGQIIRNLKLEMSQLGEYIGSSNLLAYALERSLTLFRSWFSADDCLFRCKLQSILLFGTWRTWYLQFLCFWMLASNARNLSEYMPKAWLRW